MENKVQSLHHLQGEQAYLIYWIEFYECRPRLESVMILDLNLDIIVNDEGELLAYRFDYPESMKGMFEKDGEWNYYKSKDNHPHTMIELNKKIFMQRYKAYLN